MTPSQRIDTRLHLLAKSPVSLKQNESVDLFSGAAELPAWVTLLDRDQLDPGDAGWVQLRFRQPIAVLAGDRFIIRRASPSQTIGGGEIIDPSPVRHRRFRPEVLNSLEVLAIGAPDEIVLQALEPGPLDRKTLRSSLPDGLSADQVGIAMDQLVAEGDLMILPTAGSGPKATDILLTRQRLDAMNDQFTTTLKEFHRQFPLRKGIARDELKSRLALTGPNKLFEELIRYLGSLGSLIDEGGSVRLPDFAIALPPDAEAKANRFLAELTGNQSAPPAPAEFGIEPDLLGALVDLGKVVKIADGVTYEAATYRAMESEVLGILDEHGSITIASFRDHFGTSRKYAQAVLEYLDERRITRRVGDERVRFTGVQAGRPLEGQQ